MPTKRNEKTDKSDKKNKIPPITIENAQLIYRNFSGTAKKFNAKGLRNFNIVLDLPVAKMLEDDGWNIKWDDPKEEGDEPRARIKVAVRFDNYPPRIVLITKNNRTILDEESAEILDWAEIERADIQLTGSSWDVQGKQGIKAYLRKAFITLSEEDLESKYAMGPRRQADDNDD